MTDEELQANLKTLWNHNGKVSVRMAAFGFRCAGEEKWKEIKYLVQIVESLPRGDDTTGQLFRDLRSLNLQAPYLNWPCLSLTSDAELMAVSLVVPDLRVWSFRTGKRLRKL